MIESVQLSSLLFYGFDPENEGKKIKNEHRHISFFYLDWTNLQLIKLVTVKTKFPLKSLKFLI